MKSLLVILSLALVTSPIFLVSCSTITSDSTSSRTPANDEIKFESRAENIFKKPYFTMNAQARFFHADGESAAALCRYFGFKTANSFRGTAARKIDLTLFGKDGLFTVMHQPSGAYAIEELICQN